MSDTVSGDVLEVGSGAGGLAVAVAAGIWPSRCGPEWLTTMQSTIFAPTKCSPLH